MIWWTNLLARIRKLGSNVGYILRLIGALAVGALAIAIAVFTARAKRQRLDAKEQSIEADKEKLRKVGEEGSDEDVLDEWRRSRQ